MTWGTSFHIGPNTLVKEYETLPEGWPDPLPNVGVVIKAINEKKNNKVPTHDPYTNPNAQLYYSCGCGAILDPGTKRFAELNNCASNAGWKIRFSDKGYTPYCVDCGIGVA